MSTLSAYISRSSNPLPCFFLDGEVAPVLVVLIAWGDIRPFF